MRMMIEPRRPFHAKALAILIVTTLVAVLVGCTTPVIVYSLTIESTAGGVVTTPGEDTFEYSAGTVIDLEAVADEGHRFVEWTGDVDTVGSVTSATTTITMEGDYSIAATFEEIPAVQYDLSMSSTDGGSVTTPGEGVFTYEAGAVVSLVASPASGHRFVNWTGDVDTIADVNAASTTITLEGDYNITASFVAQYVLTIGSTEGGEVTAPGEGTFTYDAGTVVELVAEADEGYRFMEWTGDVDHVTDVTAASTTVTMNSGYTITASFAKGIWDWYDLDAIRDDLAGRYVLMNDLDSTAPGYMELASTTANEGKGWQPIGGPARIDLMDPANPFAGSLDGQGYEIRDLSISRADEDNTGLFSIIDRRGVVENLGVVNTDVTGGRHVGSLAGENHGIVGTCYVSGSVTGGWRVGGLVAYNQGIVLNSHFRGSLTGDMVIAGLVAENLGTVSNSYYSYDKVLINGQNVITIGALPAADFEQWLANGMFLDINERLSREGGYYLINSLGDFKELLAFGQDSALRFKLQNDLDLTDEANFYIPYLAGEFDGNGHRISNLRLKLHSIAHVGLFGHVAAGAKISAVFMENIAMSGASSVGGLAGWSSGIVSNSYSSGSVTGDEAGGLVGNLGGTLANSYFDGSVTGESSVGGLVGLNGGTVSNSHYNHDEVLINGKNLITVGALFDEDFKQWLANDKSLDVNGRLPQEDGYYVISSVGDFRELLAFGQDPSLKFRLKGNLDLVNVPNFYIPYLAGEFDGNGHTIRNLSFSFGFVSGVALFGHVGPDGKVSAVGAENMNVTGGRQVGGLVGGNRGTVSSSYSTGQLSGVWYVGGLVGANSNTVSNSYSTASVSGGALVGGLVGWNLGTVNNCYSIGSVSGVEGVGGLVGAISLVARNSFWDVEASGVETSFAQGGAGKTTGQMKSIATFTDISTEGLDEPWDILAVDPGQTDPEYIWNIVDGETYPFLSWQPAP